jgi:hypothetical protein
MVKFFVQDNNFESAPGLVKVALLQNRRSKSVVVLQSRKLAIVDALGGVFASLETRTVISWAMILGAKRRGKWTDLITVGGGIPSGRHVA